MTEILTTTVDKFTFRVPTDRFYDEEGLWVRFEGQGIVSIGLGDFLQLSSGDVAFALSTSGKSPNVLRALAAARKLGMHTVLLTGENGRGEAASCDAAVVVPSTETAHIQEIHLASVHFICREVDRELVRRVV